MKLLSNSKRDTDIMKGFAILCIVFHNYLHWLAPSPGENEFDFSALRVGKFFQQLGEQPGEFVNIILSYLGHYGVQVFIFVSGFGLAVSMMRKQQRWGAFVLNRLKKLYPLLLTGLAVYYLAVVVMSGRSLTHAEWQEVGYKLLFIHTLLPESGLSLNGPWWFFALIFQLYLLFPLLFKVIRRWRWKGFAAVCLVSYGFVFLFREVFDLYHGTLFMQNAVAHLPEFCLGILLAFSDGKRMHWLWLVVAVAVFCLGNVFPWAYPFTFLALTVITVFVCQGLKTLRFKKRWISRPLAYFGGISMMLFVVHVTFRSPFLKLAATWPSPLGHLGAALLFFGCSWIVALGAKRLYALLLRWFALIPVREFKGGVWLQRVVQLCLVAFYLYVGGYYLRQNLAKDPSRSLSSQTLVEKGSFGTAEEFVSLAKYPLQDNYLVMKIEGSFDYKSDSDNPPLLAFDISKQLWKLAKLTTRADGEWTHYQFSYVYLRPFTSRISGNVLKIYFWNKNQNRAAFKDFHVMVYY